MRNLLKTERLNVFDHFHFLKSVFQNHLESFNMPRVATKIQRKLRVNQKFWRRNQFEVTKLMVSFQRGAAAMKEGPEMYVPPLLAFSAKSLNLFSYFWKGETRTRKMKNEWPWYTMITLFKKLWIVNLSRYRLSIISACVEMKINMKLVNY